MFEKQPDSDTPPEGSFTPEQAIKLGYKVLLGASITFGEILDADGQPVTYDFAECFKDMDTATLQDFFSRVGEDGAKLMEEG